MFAKSADKNAHLKRIIEQSTDITDKKQRQLIADIALQIFLSGRNIAGSLESALEQAKLIHKDHQAFINGEI